jgi:ribulose-bisphosphate carboxylase large chain
MSSGCLDLNSHRSLFSWSDACDPESYVTITYEVETWLGEDETAIAMAMEQSAATVHIPGYLAPGGLEALVARVRAVTPLSSVPSADTQTFDLETEVYRVGRKGRLRACRVEIAYPSSLLMDRPGQWLNVLVGEIPRLGFLAALRVTDIDFGSASLPGPTFGVPGLRAHLGVTRSPILCRSTRPAVGLDLATMGRLNTDVLTHGFHVAKDDELQAWPDASAYRAHAAAMVAARRRAEEAAGEPKGYVANLICEPAELPERLGIAESAGASAVLVAPAIQGLGVLPWVRSISRLPILAHNSFSEIFTRHPRWRIDPAVYIRMQRALGADWVVTPGPFATPGAATPEMEACARACREALGACLPSLPIIQGGKHPAGLPDYVEAAGGLDFMLIVASWVDSYPDGLPAGARCFREAVDALAAA